MDFLVGDASCGLVFDVEYPTLIVMNNNKMFSCDMSGFLRSSRVLGMLRVRIDSAPTLKAEANLRFLW